MRWANYIGNRLSNIFINSENKQVSDSLLEQSFFKKILQLMNKMGVGIPSQIHLETSQ